MKLDLLYIVFRDTKYTIFPVEKFFSAVFSLNLWITFDILMTVMSIPMFHRFHKGQNYVIHKLCITMLITF